MIINIKEYKRKKSIYMISLLLDRHRKYFSQQGIPSNFTDRRRTHASISHEFNYGRLRYEGFPLDCVRLRKSLAGIRSERDVYQDIASIIKRLVILRQRYRMCNSILLVLYFMRRCRKMVQKSHCQCQWIFYIHILLMYDGSSLNGFNENTKS